MIALTTQAAVPGMRPAHNNPNPGDAPMHAPCPGNGMATRPAQPPATDTLPAPKNPKPGGSPTPTTPNRDHHSTAAAPNSQPSSTSTPTASPSHGMAIRPTSTTGTPPTPENTKPSSDPTPTATPGRDNNNPRPGRKIAKPRAAAMPSHGHPMATRPIQAPASGTPRTPNNPKPGSDPQPISPNRDHRRATPLTQAPTTGTPRRHNTPPTPISPNRSHHRTAPTATTSGPNPRSNPMPTASQARDNNPNPRAARPAACTNRATHAGIDPHHAAPRPTALAQPARAEVAG
jgi:hypothetical protein